MSKENVRALLPSTNETPRPNERGGAPDQGRPRLRRTRVACNACKKRKSGCNGARPTCSSCHSRSLKCVYVKRDYQETHRIAQECENAALSKKSEMLQELLDYLRYMPEDASQEALRELRSNRTSLESVLELIKRGDPHTRISEQKTMISYLPSGYSHPDLELTAPYPAAYPSQIGFEELKKPKDNWAGTTIPQDSKPFDTQTPISMENYHSVDHIGYTQQPPQTELASASLPITPSGYHDPRLSQLDISFWTSIKVTNDFAAKAVSLYLETDHPLLGLFDANLFLNDLVQCNFGHCSAFLVSSLLAFACRIYTSKNTEASMLNLEFENEAEMMWHIERKTDSLLNLAGLNFLFLSAKANGRGEIELRYTNEITNMARRLKLFGVADVLTASDIQAHSGEYQVATSQTAWAAYNQLCMQAVLHLADPVEIPPALPIPENLKNKTPEEMIHQTFTASCNFWVIASEVLFVLRQPKYKHTPSAEFAFSQYQKLLAWANRLSGPMIRKHDNESHVLLVHMFFHVIILETFRPFVQDKQDDIQTWNLHTGSPNAIFAASLGQLKSLITTLEYHCPCTALTAMWHPALLMWQTEYSKPLQIPSGSSIP